MGRRGEGRRNSQQLLVTCFSLYCSQYEKHARCFIGFNIFFIENMLTFLLGLVFIIFFTVIYMFYAMQTLPLFLAPDHRNKCGIHI